MIEPITARLLIQKWQVLRTDRWQSDRLAVMPLVEANGLARLWASAAQGGLPQVLIELKVPISYVRTEGQIEVSTMPLSFRGEMLSVLVVQCNVDGLERVFADFCALALNRVQSGELPKDAVDMVLDELRELLAGADTGTPKPESAALGLAGELIVLRNLVREAPDLVEAWQGPRGSRHDFRWGKVAMEVKSYLRRQVREVSVGSLDQLKPPDGGRLYLVEVCLERDSAGDITLRNLISDIGKCVPPAGMQGILNRINEKFEGVHDSTASWSLNYLNSFIVGPGFPSLTTDHLIVGKPEYGVSHVAYRLDLSAADRWAYTGSLARALQVDSDSA